MLTYGQGMTFLACENVHLSLPGLTPSQNDFTYTVPDSVGCRVPRNWLRLPLFLLIGFVKVWLGRSSMRL